MAEIAAALARTPLATWHANAGARLVEANGWLVPAGYRTVEEEVAAMEKGGGLVEISSFGKILLTGSAVPILSWSLMGMGAAMKPHGVHAFAANGPVVGCRLAEDQLLLLASALTTMGLEQYLANICRGQQVSNNNLTTTLAGFWLIGSHVEATLRCVTDISLRAALPGPAACAQTRVAGVHAILIRSEELTLPAVRVYVGWDVGEYVWESLLRAGRETGLAAVGLEALERVRKPLPGMPASMP